MSQIPPEYSRYEKVVTVACCNFNAAWGEKEKNLAKIEAMSKTAASMGANIIAFPELALSGYECESESGCGDNGMHRAMAESVPGPSTQAVAELAKQLDVYVIFGMPERDPTDSKKIYIAASVIGPERILGTYRKLHLAPPPIWTEANCFVGGAQGMREIPVFETRYGPVGVSICYDFWMFPEIARIHMLKGARILFNCTASAAAPGPQPQPHMTHTTLARATENLAFTVSANLAGKDRTKSFYGTSTIAGPHFPRLAHIYAQGSTAEEIVIATLNFEMLHRWRSLIPVPEEQRKYSLSLIIKEFTRLAAN